MDQRILGIACALGAVAIFVLQDAVIKWLSGAYPLHEIVLARAASAVAVTLFMMRLEGGVHLLRTRRLGLHLARSGLLVIANCAFFMALAAMAIAEATAIFFVAPLMITALSALLLGETVGPRRWAAVCVGLVGVVVMTRPGAAVLQPAVLLPLVAAAAYALMQIITRRLGSTERASTIALYTQAGFVAASVTFGVVAGDGRFDPGNDPSLSFLLRQWSVPSARDALVFVAIGLGNGVGGYLMSQAYRVTRPSAIAPFEYVALPMSVMWGVVFFGHWPDAIVYGGMALICGSGLYVLHRETVVARARRRANRRNTGRRGPRPT